MRWSTTSRVTAIICGTVFAVGILIVSLLSGVEIDPTDVLSAVFAGLGALLAGIGIAAGPSKRGPGTFMILFFLFLSNSSCAAMQRGTSNPCDIQNNIVSALGVGVASVEVLPGTDSEEWNDALKYANGVVQLGHAAIRGCELMRNGAGWQQWIALALETTMSIMARFGAAGPADLPPTAPLELERAFLLLGAESINPIIQENQEEE